MSWRDRFLRLGPAWVALSYLLVAIIYIHPGEIPLLEGARDLTLGDGTDPAGMSYYFEFMVQRFSEHPADFLFGAIHMPYTDAPTGASLVVSMGQRIAVLLMAPMVPSEQMAACLVLIGMTLNGFFMYLLGRMLQMPKTVSWGLGFAWAINAYTRARAKVHMGSVGIYHLPLVLLGLHLVAKGGRRNTLCAALCFLTIAFMNHYLIVMLAMAAPILVWYAHSIKRSDERALIYWKRLALCAIPGVFWLVSNLIIPMAPWVKFTGPVLPQTGVTSEAYHPFLSRFAARPMDYFTGDVGIGIRDTNPLRETMNRYVSQTRYEGSNPHERAEGIRWSLWILGLLSFVSFFPSQKAKGWASSERILILQLAALGVLSFLLSQSPEDYGAMSPALWLHKLVPQFRVPNRAAIGVNFSLLILAGLTLRHWLGGPMKPVFKRTLSVVFIALLVFELPPFYQDMPTFPIRPPIQRLARGEACGIGLSYPYVSNTRDLMDFYWFLQRMRGSRCSFLNASTAGLVNTELVQRFSPATVFQSLANQQDGKFSELRHLVECVPLSWVVFHSPLTREQATLMCGQLGWKLGEDGLCSGETLQRPYLRDPASCLTSR